MTKHSHLLAIYLYLARASMRRLRPLVRDRMLVLAAAIAAEMQLDLLAAHCRRIVVDHNPKHILGKWPTVTEALEDEDFRVFLRQLRRRYPPEKAERMLDSLGWEIWGERDAYYSDLEYGASILGTTPDELEELYGAS